MNDPRTEAARIGFWDEGLAQYETTADLLTRRGLIQREEDPTHECD